MGFVTIGADAPVYRNTGGTEREISITSDGIYVFGEAEHIEIVEAENSIATIYFDSGETATNFVYPDSLLLKGDDCEDHIFVPAANRHYEVCIDSLSGVVTGHVSAFDMEEAEA